MLYNYKVFLSLLLFFMLSTSLAYGRHFRYLVIPCGGELGLIPAYLLEDLEDSLGKPAYMLFDGMFGSSTGGAISALLSVPKPNEKQPYSAAEVVQLYESMGSTQFMIILKGLFLALWNGDRTYPMRAAAQAVFGNRWLSEARTRLGIMSFNVTGQRHYLFDSRDVVENKNYEYDVSVAGAVAASASVKLLFGPIQPQFNQTASKGLFVDPASGGILKPTCNPTFQWMERVSQELGEEDEATFYFLGTGFGKFFDSDFYQGKKIKLVVIEPDTRQLSWGESNLLANYMGAMASPWELYPIAQKLRHSRAYQKMCRDLGERWAKRVPPPMPQKSAHDEL